jgi:hypothetical protein
MPRVKIIQVFNHNGDEYYADESDLADITDWEDVPQEDMHHLKAWILSKKQGYYTPTYRSEPNYAILIQPEPGVSAIGSIKEIVDKYKAEQERDAKRRDESAKRYEATKVERKRKQLEKLKRELGE